MSVGPVEIVIVLVLALLVFGPKRLPQAGRSLGEAMREFRKVTSTAREELGLDEVATGLGELRSSLSLDLNAAAPPPAQSGTDAPDAPSAPQTPHPPGEPAAVPAPAESSTEQPSAPSA